MREWSTALAPIQRATAIDERFADRVRMLREARRLRQPDVAALVGMTPGAYRYVEVGQSVNGARRRISVGESVVFAEAFGVPLAWMVAAEPLPSAALLGPVDR